MLRSAGCSGSSAPRILSSTRNQSREVLFQYTEYKKLLHVLYAMHTIWIGLVRMKLPGTRHYTPSDRLTWIITAYFKLT